MINRGHFKAASQINGAISGEAHSRPALQASAVLKPKLQGYVALNYPEELEITNYLLFEDGSGILLLDDGYQVEI
jgi:hypothetical protein